MSVKVGVGALDEEFSENVRVPVNEVIEIEGVEIVIAKSENDVVRVPPNPLTVAAAVELTESLAASEVERMAEKVVAKPMLL